MARLAPALLVVLWSSGFVGATLAARSAPAETTLLWRYAVAAPPMVLVVAVLGRRYSWKYLRREAVLGALGQAGYLYGVFRAADAGLPAGTTALVASLQPALVAVVLAALPAAGKRRGGVPSRLSRSVRRRRWLALTAGFAGVVLAVGGDGAGMSVGTSPSALGWAAAGMLSLAAATLLAERWPPAADHDVLDSLAVQSVVALVAFGLLAVASGRALPPPAPSFWVAVVWLVVLSFAGGYGAYLWVLRTSGAVAVSAWLYLTPAVSAAWGLLMFGDALSWAAAAGFAVALAAVLGMRSAPTSTSPRKGERMMHLLRSIAAALRSFARAVDTAHAIQLGLLAPEKRRPGP
ncbi:DMT family transporter [Myceligenerans salitolerans]|uniref:EamA family transporter n=1 Tax=Myceligenerans salitolerans TaxID=1230528 RepID=A0ABS3I661_9MICO|nr:EamA family transporter [Myceligenerans salitolerans]MBO0608490.1 EamA family transporter [Myceligenerans salitolerans]